MCRTSFDKNVVCNKWFKKLKVLVPQFISDLDSLAFSVTALRTAEVGIAGLKYEFLSLECL